MEPLAIVLTGISAVTGALCVVAKLLWGQVKDFKADNKRLHAELSDLRMKIGSLQTYRDIVLNCRTPGCPYRPQSTITNNHEN